MLMKSDLNLEHMSLVHTSSEEVLRIGTAFLVSVYEGKPTTDLNCLRYEKFTKKVKTPSTKSLPPTNESAVNHIKRAHLQTLIWCSADIDEPPNLDGTKYGWQINENNIAQPLYGS